MNEPLGWALCVACLDDDFLLSLLKKDLSSALSCAVCATSPAADAGSFFLAFKFGVDRQFTSPDEAAMPFDDEGQNGYWGGTYDSTEELISDVFSFVGRQEVLDLLAAELEPQFWASRDWARGSAETVLLDGWKDFTTSIATRGRFLSAIVPSQVSFPDEPDPRKILEEIADVAVGAGIIRELPAESTFWRARTNDSSRPEWRAKDLGTPPVDFAQNPNRMSPVGIPLFYGASSHDLAVAETIQRSRGGEWVMIGEFALERSITVLDLTSIPKAPSEFDADRREDYGPLTLLHRLAQDLRFPVRDQWLHIDYIPTQVITEYFLRVFGGGKAVQGIAYTSTRGLPGMCVAIDIPSDNCVDEGTPAPVREVWRPAKEPAPRLALRVASVAAYEVETSIAL